MRPIMLFTGQWADLPLETLCKKARAFGYDGLELACWGDHFDVRAAIDSKSGPSYLKKKWLTLQKHGLTCFALSAHLTGQAVCDPIDARHQPILPDHVWGDGDPEGVRRRAAEELKLTAIAARKFFEAAPKNIRRHLESTTAGTYTINGFTGSPIWHLLYSFPPVLPGQIDAGYADFADRFLPILDVFQKNNCRFALEVHPTEIAFDIVTAHRALAAVNHHPAFGFNFDPSHFVYQGVDYVQFIREFSPSAMSPSRIFNVHMKDAHVSPTPRRSGTFGGHLHFGDPQRHWDFRTLGRGSVRFEEIIRALNAAQYHGPLAVEWEDSHMDREHGAKEAATFVRSLDFPPSQIAFDAQFDK